MINKPDVFTLQDALECMKQCEEHLQKEKRKVLNIAHNKGEILHLFKESKEFIDTSHNMKYEQKHHHV